MVTSTGLLAATPGVLSLLRDLRHGTELAALDSIPLQTQVVQGDADIWLTMRDAASGMALRLVSSPGGWTTASARVLKGGCAIRIRATGAAGTFVTDLTVAAEPMPVLEWRTVLTPKQDIRMPVRERDLYPLGRGGDPRRARGRVEAAQRGLNTALVFLRMHGETFNSALYVQDLTALNEFLRQSGITPNGIVGGEWPELGLLAAAPVLGGHREADPLQAGRPVTISRGILVIDARPYEGAQESALRFIELLAAAYPHLDHPPVEYRDWPDRAERSLSDLATSRKIRTTFERRTYARPYVNAENPDVMVQASLASSLREYAAWSGSADAWHVARQFSAGLPAFHDARLGSMRRYLPNVGADKDADAVDSWYLYHPMVTLGRLAGLGDEQARQLFEDSLEYCITAAHHFDYAWPIQYAMSDFRVITPSRDDHGRGQTDVGGLYAYVMLQAFELLQDPRYLDEAIAAVDASMGARFELNYQANITAWGAAACLRLWRVTSDDRHLRQCYVYLASYLHNCQMWESELGWAQHYRTFFTPTCLHDATYVAAYEAFDSFIAFEELLRLGGVDLSPAARMLVSEHCAYALESTWWSYPDVLPKESLATTIRTGEIDVSLSIPLEDVYADGQPAGQVGQEVYGAGGALSFVTRLLHRNDSAPFDIFCNRFVSHADTSMAKAWTLRLESTNSTPVLLVLLRRPHRSWPTLHVESEHGPLRPSRRREDRIEYRVDHGTELTVRW